MFRLWLCIKPRNRSTKHAKYASRNVQERRIISEVPEDFRNFEVGCYISPYRMSLCIDQSDVVKHTCICLTHSGSSGLGKSPRS